MRYVLLAMGDVPGEVSSEEAARARRIAEEIGRKIAAVDVGLIHGGRRGTLATTALSALAATVQEDDFKRRVFTYLPKMSESSEIPRDDFETFGRSIEKGEWPEERRQRMVEDADVVILMGEGRGIVDMARITRRLARFVIPIPIAGGPAREEYEAALRTWSPNEVASQMLFSLGDIRDEPAAVAISVVGLLQAFVRRTIRLKKVFLAMPFVEEFAEKDDAEDGLGEVCKEYGWEVDIARDTPGEEPVISEIFSRIERCEVFVAYLDCNRPNVYFEAGYARGLGKPVILCMKAGGKSAFDTEAFEQIRWKTIRELRAKLKGRIETLISQRRVIR